MRTQIVARAGNYIALASSQRLQSDPRDFLRCFSILRRGNQTRLAGYFVKLRVRGTWAQRANADAVGSNLFGESFGKQQIKCFRGGVGGNKRHRLKGRSRG